MIPKEAVRGGKVEAFVAYWSAEDMPGTCVKYFDKNSMYPGVTTVNVFPSGPPQLIDTPTALQSIVVEHDAHKPSETTSEKEDKSSQVHCVRFMSPTHGKLWGIAHVKIWVPPENLRHQSRLYPFLPLKYKNKSMCVLCRSCMEEDNLLLCTHTSRESRSWTAHYTTPELEYAVHWGYEILQFFAVQHYPSSTNCFKEHFERLAAQKCASELPEGCKPGCAKTTPVCPALQKHVDGINEGFTTVQIRAEDVAHNPQKRAFIKLVMNSLLGKFSQNTCAKIQTDIITDADATLRKIIDPSVTLDYAEMIPQSKMLLLQYHKEGYAEMSNIGFDCVTGAFVTAYARIKLHQTLEALAAAGCIILYTDTDCIIYICGNQMHKINPLTDLHKARLGAWSNELNDTLHEEIVRATVLGAKNYCLETKIDDSAGAAVDGVEHPPSRKTKYHLKVRGFNFQQTEMAAKLVDRNLMKEMLDQQLELGDLWIQRLKKHKKGWNPGGVGMPSMCLAEASEDEEEEEETCPSLTQLLQGLAIDKQKQQQNMQLLQATIPQTSFITSNKASQQIVTKNYDKMYANTVEPKRVLLGHWLKQERQAGRLHYHQLIADQLASARNCIPYLTVPFGFDISCVSLLLFHLAKLLQ